MKKLSQYTKILRSKNAGPLYITFDLIFETGEDREYVRERLGRDLVAGAYGVDPADVRITPYAVVNAIKITFPRKHVSGSLRDDDIYGCQQHVPLSQIEL